MLGNYLNSKLRFCCIYWVVFAKRGTLRILSRCTLDGEKKDKSLSPIPFVNKREQRMTCHTQAQTIQMIRLFPGVYPLKLGGI